MKRQLLSAFVLTAATFAAIAPVARAAESKAITNIQQTRLEFLENQTKAVENVHQFRLEGLDARDKAITDIQQTRLEFLENQTKAVR